MRFFSKEASQKLAALGCESSSGYLKTWFIDYKLKSCFAFTISDFLDTTEQARKNCEILWPESCGAIKLRYDPQIEDNTSFFLSGMDEIGIKPSKWHLFRALESKDAIKYIEGFLK